MNEKYYYVAPHFKYGYVIHEMYVAKWFDDNIVDLENKYIRVRLYKDQLCITPEEAKEKQLNQIRQQIKDFRLLYAAIDKIDCNDPLFYREKLALLELSSC